MPREYYYGVEGLWIELGREPRRLDVDVQSAKI